jgi:four helix bundle protein
MQDFHNLDVWRKAHEITLSVYRLTSAFPQTEVYGLTSQIRRAAASVGANLAEGCGRGSDVDFKRFVQMAMGSASELEYHLLLSRDLGYLAPDRFNELVTEITSVRRMLSALIKRLSPATTSGRQPIANSR